MNRYLTIATFLVLFLVPLAGFAQDENVGAGCPQGTESLASYKFDTGTFAYNEIDAFVNGDGEAGTWGAAFPIESIVLTAGTHSQSFAVNADKGSYSSGQILGNTALNDISSITFCAVPLCSNTRAAPSWDGRMRTKEGLAFLEVRYPLGYDSLSVTGKNIALEGVYKPDSEEPAEAGDKQVKVVLRAISGGTSSFFLFFQDQVCSGRIVQVDPVLDFFAASAGSGDGEVPARFVLEQNYPNPFNPSTSIGVQVPVASHLTLSVYDILGRLVKTIVSGDVQAGYHAFTWDGTDLSGDPVPSGLYLYRAEAGSFSSVRQMALIR